MTKLKAGDIAYVLNDMALGRMAINPTQIIGPVKDGCIPILHTKGFGYLVDPTDVRIFKIDPKYIGQYFVRIGETEIITTRPNEQR